ncbi:BQ5605_C005g03525 [Microbotryum silenes-dioicae]|uniref:BQ5605_C005g03525 protein n=1 Tax=Microbotryum silenes-dioicae TaxID=796604 RepID=A0A2X0MAU9_9BASI|nr:BQ5605_C005g03525 [Microbotryum silenes-dioicae]
MPLKLLHHKSFHVYKAENVARVARDEALARAEGEENERRGTVADSEARLGRMRARMGLVEMEGKGGRRKRGRGEEGGEAEKRLEKQLKGKGKGKEEGNRADGKGHLNFWAEFEAGAKPNSFENAERKLEKAVEQQKVDELTKVYLAKKGEGDMKGWYASEDGQTEKERKLSDEMRLERAYKDGENKRLTDPLALMQSYLKRRDQVLDSSKAASSSSSTRFRTPATPDTERGDLSPIITSLLAPKRRKGDPKPRSRPAPSSPISHSDPSTSTSPSTSSHPTLDPRTEAVRRVSSERARALAVIAARKKERQGSDAGSVASTPARSEFGAQGYGMFNREETRDARGRWREGRGGSGLGSSGGGESGSGSGGWGEQKRRREERSRGGERGWGGRGGE